jgi:GTPase
VIDGRRIAWLHAHGDVLAEDDAGDSDQGPMRRLTVRLNPKELGQFASLSL